jgi:hypothetical protein
LGINKKDKRVKRFVNDNGYTGEVWNFLETAIDDWWKARNYAFHEGKEGTEELSYDLLARRGKQIRDFASLVFVEMLQKQEYSRKIQLLSEFKIINCISW